MDWQSPSKIGDVQVPALVGRDAGAGYNDTVAVTVYGWAVPRLPGSNTGHGRVWRRPDGAVADCGGPHPGTCGQCTADVDLVTEMFDSINAGF